MVAFRNDTLRAAILALIMGGSCWLAVALTPRTFLADLQPRQKLAQIVPMQFDGWSRDTSIVPIAPSPDLQKVIDETYDETVAVTYKNAAGDRIMLSLAYGRNQHKGMMTHRPDVCYPAQGFKITSGTSDSAIDFRGRPLPVKHLVAAMGQRNEPITYWVMVGDEITQFGYPFRLIAMKYGLRGEIPDGVLVRVSSIDQDNARGFAVQAAFVQAFLAAMPQSQRHRLVGSDYP